MLAVFGGGGYVAGGVYSGAKLRGGPVALQSHPHHQQWMEVCGLVEDGWRFARARVAMDGTVISTPTIIFRH